MVLVILGVAIVISILGTFIAKKTRYEVGGFVTAIMAAIIAFTALVYCLYLGTEISKLEIVDDKIAMYQEENSRIESQISDIVTQYKKYETDFFTEISPDSAITWVALYPELKADTLVQKQIDVYVANNEKIKELRETEINGSVIRWWFYFGN